MTLFFIPTIYSQQIYSDTTWERWYGLQNYNESMSAKNHHIECYDKGYLFHGKDDYTNDFEKPVLRKTDINGKVTRTFNVNQTKGVQAWDTREIPAGSYIYTLKTKYFEESGKLIIQ